MPGVTNLVKPSEIQVCLVDIAYPCGPFGVFQDLLFLDPTDPDESSRLLSKAVTLVRKMLISIDKVNTVYTLTGRENVHISEILEMYQEKAHIYDYTQLKTRHRIPIETTAKFLNSCIEKLEGHLTANNWKKIHEKMIAELEERSSRLDKILLENKMALTMALQSLEKANNAMQVSLDRGLKHQLIRIINEKVISNLQFPVCVTSGQIRQNILSNFGKKLDKKKLASLEDQFMGARLMVTDLSECIHQRMDDAGVHCFLLYGTSHMTFC